MIVKEKFFDIISRTADDVNNPDLTIDEIIRYYKEREEKYNKQLNDKTTNVE